MTATVVLSLFTDWVKAGDVEPVKLGSPCSSRWR